MDNVYQEVFEILEELLPKKWEKVIFYAEYSMDSYSMKYYIQPFCMDCEGLGVPQKKESVPASRRIAHIARDTAQTAYLY